MNISLEDYHRIPTYAEFIQEAVIHATETIKYNNIIATQLRTTQQLTRFDGENCLDVNFLNSNDMKQNLQQTAVQRALQPVARSIPTGLEQFDMADTEDKIQQQVHDNESLLDEARLREKNDMIIYKVSLIMRTQVK